ncbi:ABC transporter domain-containing protein [Forsythia ovata]|uniref:ABC transporter domain-containing protein n=1 Tax=Forsythia ovata TaxID=205694 RepID=A0ABD1SLN0_9LAMI
MAAVRDSMLPRFLKLLKRPRMMIMLNPLKVFHQLPGLIQQQRSSWPTLFQGRNATTTADPVTGEMFFMRTKVLLNDISGEAHDGEIMAVMGASGSGKSTLVDALANRMAKESLQTPQKSLQILEKNVSPSFNRSARPPECCESSGMAPPPLS